MTEGVKFENDEEVEGILHNWFSRAAEIHNQEVMRVLWVGYIIYWPIFFRPPENRALYAVWPEKVKRGTEIVIEQHFCIACFN